MSEVRYVFRRGKIVPANEEETLAILERENKTQEQQDQERLEERGVEFLEEIRQQRNALLLQSDWTQTLDSPLTTEQKTSWATYRQELRDFMSSFMDDEGNPNSNVLNPITWPIKPS
jgi:hypothetical protein